MLRYLLTLLDNGDELLLLFTATQNVGGPSEFGFLMEDGSGYLLLEDNASYLLKE